MPGAGCSDCTSAEHRTGRRAGCCRYSFGHHPPYSAAGRRGWNSEPGRRREAPCQVRLLAASLMKSRKRFAESVFALAPDTLYILTPAAG